MNILINLLPAEFREQELKRTKFYRIQTFGVIVILIIIFLASLTIALRILQSQNIKAVRANYAQAEEKVSGLKNRQASLLLLKNRLAAINQYLDAPSKQNTIFKLIDQILPPQIITTSLNVEKSGDVSIVAVTPDILTVDKVIESLLDKQQNQDKISQISIENLNRSRDGLFRISFKIKTQ